MKTRQTLGIFLFEILLLTSSIVGYTSMVEPHYSSMVGPSYSSIGEPLYSRSFGLFNLFPLKRVGTDKHNGLTIRVAALETSLRLLAAQVAASAEKCPPTSLGLNAKLIGTYCYSVSAPTATFANALSACQTAGGTLAEPLPNPAASNNLYNALKAAFSSEFIIIEALNGGQLWIGYFTPPPPPPVIPPAPPATTFPFQSVTTNAVVSPFPTTTVVTAIGTASNQGALLNRPGGASYWVPDIQSDSNPYVCQYVALA